MCFLSFLFTLIIYLNQLCFLTFLFMRLLKEHVFHSIFLDSKFITVAGIFACNVCKLDNIFNSIMFHMKNESIFRIFTNCFTEIHKSRLLLFLIKHVVSRSNTYLPNSSFYYTQILLRSSTYEIVKVQHL